MTKKGHAATDISYWASEAERSLTGTGDAVETFAQRILAEPASARRKILQHLLLLMNARKQSLPAAATSSLLRLILDPGKCNWEVAAGYLGTIFDCANSVESAHRDDCLRVTFTLLLTKFGEGASDHSRSLPPSAIQALAAVHAFVKALELCLTQEDQYALLRRQFPFWSVVVPELAAKPAPLRSPEAARVICKMIQEQKEPIPAPLKLSLLPLQRVADAYQVSDRSRHLPAARHIDGQEPQSVSPAVPVKESGPVLPTPFSLPALRTAENSISAALVNLNRDVESAMGALSESIARLETERNAARTEVSRLGDQCAALERRKESLSRDLEDLRQRFQLQQLQLQAAETKLAEYDRHLESMHRAADLRETDAIHRTKRSFASGQLTALTSLREYLARLRAAPSELTATMAISNFNRLAKFLLAEKYVTDTELTLIGDSPQIGNAT